MIADAPYEIRSSVLTARAGMVTGIVGAAVMLGIVAAVEPLSGLTLTVMISTIGATTWQAGGPSETGGLLLAVGMGVHSTLGLGLGLLYAVCQQRAKVRGIVGTGVFYGFFLWVVGSVVVGSLLGESTRAIIRSWPWLLACLSYGVSLALVAIWSVRRGEDRAIAVPMD